jgi:hypothetical protein
MNRLEEELEKRNNTIDKIMHSMTAKKENALADLSDLLLGESSDPVSTIDTTVLPLTISSKRSSSINASGLTNSTNNNQQPEIPNATNGNQDQMILILQTQRDRYKEKLTMVSQL